MASTFFRVYRGTSLPPAYERMVRNIATKGEWERLCRGSVNHDYGTGAIDAVLNPRHENYNGKANRGGYVALALRRPPAGSKTKAKVVAFATILTHEFVSPLKKPPAPICKPDELYLDVVCAQALSKGQATERKRRQRLGHRVGETVGVRMLRHVERVAASRLKKRALRLYAIPSARGFWEGKMKYQECDSPCGACTYKRLRYPVELEEDGIELAGVRMTKCISASSMRRH